MPRVFLKMALLIAILIAIKAPFFYFYKGDVDQLQEGFAAQDFNAAFIGSSRIRSAVIPPYFDSLSDVRTKSYNFGVLGGVGNKTIERAREVIVSKPSLKYLFVELSGIGVEGVGLTEEPWQSFTFSGYWQLISKTPLKELGPFHDRLISRTLRPNLSKNRRDFNVDLAAAMRKQELVKPGPVSEEGLDRKRELSKRIGTESYKVENESIRKGVDELIEFAESRGISIRFLVLPRLANESEMKAVASIYRKLARKNILASPHSDNSFYTRETSIDGGHLNHAGAMKFTKDLALEFNRINRTIP